MRNDIPRGKQLQIRRKKRHHWSILTLDDLDKTNWKHSRLITQLQTQYRADKEPGKDKPNQKSVDFSI